MAFGLKWCRFHELTVHDLHDALALRARVFVVEQACAYADVDGLDPAAHHLLMRDGHGALLGYLRAFEPGTLREEAVIGRVVTERRSQGDGSRLMRAAMERVGAWGAPVWLSAQAHLEGWYGRFGFTVCGPGYDEDGIPHVPMRAASGP